ncbi:MAG: DUF5060 domain-containing protein [candidate division KSB1 bacterium]|nr:DUF5060 domain-containing protein [candidate division KSB1 bacterium]
MIKFFIYMIWVFPVAAQALQVTGFTIVNADTDQDIMALEDGDTINRATLPDNLNVRAELDQSGDIGSVKFEYNSNTSYRTENVEPYCIAGDSPQGDYSSWGSEPGVGEHRIKAVPYSSDAAGGTQGTALEISFTVIDQPGPVADAGTDQTLYLPTDQAALDGSGSTALTDPMDAWNWTQISGPNSAVLANTDQAVCTASGLVEGSYVFRLWIEDDGIADSATVTVDVDPGTPVADAGSDQLIIEPQSSVTLDGSASSDVASGQITGYLWQQVSGPSTASLGTPDAVTCEASGLEHGTYLFSLTVTDDDNYQDADSVQVRVLSESGGAVISGELKKWHTVTVTFTSAQTFSETGDPNPFLDYRLNVTFTGPQGQVYEVPGYFAADGDAANTGASSGDQWRAHLSPDAEGKWLFDASFCTGTDIAVSDDPNFGAAVSPIDGAAGSFSIGINDKSAPDLRAKGRLNVVGGHYLQFEETGEYFLKQGADAPENFLAFEDFDGSFKTDGESDNRIKSWSPHLGDWTSGDPSWQGDRGKAIIGAVNYLASEGMNAFSFLTMNIGGDDKNVFPYLNYNNNSAPQDDRRRFDCSRLDQWGIVFDHGTSKGMYLHFKTQETENELLLDGGAVGVERKLYYRELIARYAHNLALNWNLGEENNNQSTQQRKDMAQYFYDHDPYHHNIVIHNGASPSDLLGSASKLTGFSLQTNRSDFANVHSHVLNWVQNSAAAGVPWVVACDEPGDASHALVPDADDPDHNNARINALWGTFMAQGAGNEWYFGYQHDESDLTCEDWRSRDLWWDQCRYALEFFDQVPFWLMQNDDNLVTSGQDHYGMKAESAPDYYYVIFLKNGDQNSDVVVDVQDGEYEIAWFDPRSGGALQHGTTNWVSAAGSANIGQAPYDHTRDWAVYLTTDDTLSVTLTSFTAQQQGDSVWVRWTSESEVDHLGYNLYRRTGTQTDYVKLNNPLIVTTREGSSVQQHSYEYIDIPDHTGRLYYRLEAVDTSGRTRFYGPVTVQFTTGIQDKQLPGQHHLYPNHPNPFNPNTMIRFDLAAAEHVSLDIYNVHGIQVRTLMDRRMPAGQHRLQWDARDDSGQIVPSGVYFYRLKAGEFEDMGSMVLLR